MPNLKVSKKIPKKNKITNHQNGGSSTDYAASWYAPYADPAQLSRFTLKYIDQAPMFNPLETGTIIPTGTSGIIPTGAYYDAMAPLTIQNSIGPPVAQYAQFGGLKKTKANKSTQSKKSTNNPWIAHVFKFAKDNALTYGQALKHPNVRQGYTRTK